MRPELQDMTVSDWMDAKLNMNSNSFKQLVRVAKAGHISVPSIVVPNFNPRITFVSESDTEQFFRVKDTEALNKFNNDVQEWGIKVGMELKRAASASFKHRDSKNVSDDFPPLADSISLNLRFDKKFKLETRSVGFSLARHGVYLHQGAGRGYGGLTGSKWTDKYGQKKTTNPASLGLQGTGSRTAVHWFNDVIRKNLPQLTEILANYSLDLLLNTDSIFLPE